VSCGDPAVDKAARLLAERIARFNAGRDPERLRMKYDAMRTSPFAFLRGTCHLFYERLPGSRLLEKAPAAWLCGDLHLQNFGSYKGDDRLVYFDINDFDEALLAPCTLDLVRCGTSVLLAAGPLGFDGSQARKLARRFLDAYAGAIEAGKARWIERDSATGLIASLLNALRLRKRKMFLNKHTRLVKGRRKLRIDGERTLPASPAQRRTATRFMGRFAKSQSNPKFFRLLDVARRIAGTGSLGVERYVLLVEGKGSPDGNYLLDLKQALPSALKPRVEQKQPKWKSEAHRIVTLERRIQAASMAFLTPVMVNGGPFVLRGLQPREDRVALSRANDRQQVEELMKDMGRLVAWGQLRSSGRQRSASADQLIEYWGKGTRVRDLMAIAQDCAERVQSDWRAYCQAFDAGLLDSASVVRRPLRAPATKAGKKPGKGRPR
jgi:uncharacterized protein (DUF2252 family)